MMDWKVGDRVLWVDGNEVTGEEGEVLNVDDNWVSIKWQDMDEVGTYDPYEKCLVRWPK